MYSRDTGSEYLVCKLLSAPRKSGDFPGGKKKNNKKNRLFTFLSKFPRFKKIIKTYVSFWDSCHHNYEALFSSMSGYRKVIKLVVN